MKRVGKRIPLIVFGVSVDRNFPWILWSWHAT